MNYQFQNIVDLRKIKSTNKKTGATIHARKHLPAYLVGSLLVIIAFILFNPAFAYQPPTQNPPLGNIPVPINVGTSTQTKSGSLIVATATNAYLLIGTTTSSDLGSVYKFFFAADGNTKQAYFSGTTTIQRLNVSGGGGGTLLTVSGITKIQGGVLNTENITASKQIKADIANATSEYGFYSERLLADAQGLYPAFFDYFDVSTANATVTPPTGSFRDALGFGYSGFYQFENYGGNTSGTMISGHYESVVGSLTNATGLYFERFTEGTNAQKKWDVHITGANRNRYNGSTTCGASNGQGTITFTDVLPDINYSITFGVASPTAFIAGGAGPLIYQGTKRTTGFDYGIFYYDELVGDRMTEWNCNSTPVIFDWQVIRFY